MQVFKTFFLIIKNYKWSVIIGLLITFAMSVLLVKSNQMSGSVSDTKASVVIVDEDHSMQSKALSKQLEKVCDVSDEDLDKIEEALYNRIVSYVLYIPKGYGERIKNGERVELAKKQVPDSYAAYLVDEHVSAYSNSLSDYYKYTNLSDTRIIKLSNQSVKSNIKTEITSQKTESVNLYFNFLLYGLLSCIITGLGVTTLAFKKSELKKRNYISPMSTFSYNWQMIMGYGVFGLALFVLVAAFAYLAFPSGMSTSSSFLYLINTFALMIMSLSLAYLLSFFSKSMNVLGFISNAVCLGMAFLCGSFIPQEMLSEGVINFSKILPGFYFASNNEMIYEMNSVTMEKLMPILINLLVIIGFGILFFILAMIVGKKQRRAIG